MRSLRLFSAIFAVGAVLLSACHQDGPPLDITADVVLDEDVSKPVQRPGTPPPDATCVTIERGVLGQVWDADISYGNGTWATGAYPFSWTGPSPYDHWSAYRFDLSPVPPGNQVVSATFTVSVAWNDQSSTVRAHRILADWDEATVTWQSFGGVASWDAAVIASFDPIGVGTKSIDVTSLVQAWASGSVPNQGLLLEEDPVKLHLFYASEAGSVGVRPRLEVCYTANGPCAGKADGDACDDGNACTLGETCLGTQCIGGVPKACDPLDACHDAGVCDPVTGVCSDPPKPDGSPCDDGDACTNTDMCQGAACVGLAINCDDSNPCNGVEICDPASGCGAGAPLDCGDGNACTADACDPASGCTHAAVSCDDSDACTTDACDPATGCTHAAVDSSDALSCTEDSCAGGANRHRVHCLPGQPCSQSFCSSAQAQDPQFAWLCQ